MTLFSKLIFTLTIASFLITTQYSFAVNWILVGKDDDMIGYMDTDSVNHTLSEVAFWFKTTTKKVVLEPNVKFKYNEKKTFYRINCLKKMIKQEYAYYYLNKKLVYQFDFSSLDKFKPADPDYIFNGLIQLACEANINNYQ